MGSSSNKEDQAIFLMSGTIAGFEDKNTSINKSSSKKEVEKSISSFKNDTFKPSENEYFQKISNYEINKSNKEQNSSKISSSKNKNTKKRKENSFSTNIMNGGNEIRNMNNINNNYINDNQNKNSFDKFNFEFREKINVENKNYKNLSESFPNPIDNTNKSSNIDNFIKENNNTNLNINKIKENKDNEINEICTYPNLSEIYMITDNKELNNSNFEDSEFKDINIFSIPKENFSEVENFMKENKIQDEFSENENNDNTNKTYKELKKYEIEQLKKIFYENKDTFKENNLNQNNLILNFDTNLISNIIENENTTKVFKNKIIKEIEIIKSDEKKYGIDHLTILLVGKTKVGKKSLIKYMLKLGDSQLKKEAGGTKRDFQAFQSSKIPYLRLVKYKGIGLGKDNDAEIVTKQTIDYIKRQNKKPSYNDFVHCIWYCVTGTRMEFLEEEYLKKLRNAYSSVNMPIILIYLDEYSKQKISDMEEKIKKKLDVNFINVISHKITKPNNSGIVEPKGENELLNLTLDKCRVALQNDMPKIMMKNISNEILYKMKNLVETNKNKIKDLIKEKFIKEFTIILNDQEFNNYIITLLGRNLSIFYEQSISNKSLNLIINSEIISTVKAFMKQCKSFTRNLIASDIISKAKDFIDKQACLEKINQENINIENKRTLKGFIKSNEIFLKKNYYYISQKYIIYNFIVYYCKDYFNEFQKQFNVIIENLINQEENSEINKFIADCFGSKLKKFGEKMKVNFGIEKYENNINKSFNASLDNNNNFKNERLIIEVENGSNNSFENNDEEEDLVVYNKEENEKIINKSLVNFFKLKNNWRYLNKELSLILLSFMTNFKYMDTKNNYFTRNNFFNNELINSLKDYEKNILEIYLNNNIQPFLVLIDENFKKITNKYDLINNKTSIIKKILENENLEKVQMFKIKTEFEGLEKDIKYKQMNYLTVIITGRTGVGKSALINALLKEHLAEEGMKDIVTTFPYKYGNQKVPFLKLIDTRGIEIGKDYGVHNISEEIFNIINDPNQLEKYKNEKSDFSDYLNEKKPSIYNDHVQCVWYCVSGSSLENEEIEFIKNMKLQKNKVPIIIVYTMSENEDKMQKMKFQVINNFKGIPYIEVLSKDEDEIPSFGLDKLINKTIEQCKSAYGTNSFEIMREQTNQKIFNYLKNKNASINYSVNNESVSYFINNFDQTVIENKKFKNFLYYLFAILFNGYLTTEKEAKISENLYNTIFKEFNNDNISEYIEEIIKCYNEISAIFINKIMEEKALQFLDKQAAHEKNNSNLEIKDKCNKSDFMEIIESFLKNNFCYLAERYFVYHIFIHIIENFSEKIEKEVNENLKIILSNNSLVLQFFKNIYTRKVEDLNEIIEEFLKKEGYHKLNNNSIKKSNIEHIEKKNDMINFDEIDKLTIGEGIDNLFNKDK